MPGQSKPQVTDEPSGTLPVVSSRDKVMQAIAAMKRDTSDVSDKIMSNILDAENTDDVFAQTSGEGATLMPMESRYNVPLKVLTVSLNPSTFSEGPAAYAVLEVVNLWSDEEEVIGCGASNIVAGLIKLHQLGSLPVDVVVYESAKRTANGYNVTLMRRATDDDVKRGTERF